MKTAIALSSPPQAETYWQWRGYDVHYVHANNDWAESIEGVPGLASTKVVKPPLLLVHGFGASTDHWRKNIAELKQCFNVWAIDLLGFGRSAKPEIDYTADLWRDQLHDFMMDKMGGVAVLVGNSLGGYVSLCVAAQSPQSVRGLILLNSAGPFSDALLSQKTSKFSTTFQRLVRKVLLYPIPSYLLFQYTRRRSVIRKTLTKVYLDSTAVTEQLVDDIYRPSCDRGAAKVFASVFKAKQGESVDYLLDKISCPVLALWGEGDPWMKVHERGKKFRDHYPDVTEYYLQAGHCPHDEVPLQVNRLIVDWMEMEVMKLS